MRQARFLALAYLIVIASQLVLGVCDPKQTPSMNLPASFKLVEDSPFSFDINTTNMPEDSVSYAIVPLERQLTGLTLDTRGWVQFTPSRDDQGLTRVAFLAVNGTCAQTTVVGVNVYVKPDVIAVAPADITLQTKQTDVIKFEILVVDGDGESQFDIRWLLDGNYINGTSGNKSITYRPGYSISGLHNMTVVVTDPQNLSESASWMLQIGRVNRPPVLVHSLPDFAVFKNTASRAYSLRDYFMDPEGNAMHFSYVQVFPSYYNFSYANISVNISSDGTLDFSPALNTRGAAYFVFNATDPFNLTAQSDVVKVDVLDYEFIKNQFVDISEEFCGNQFCGPLENCTSCSYDCGVCEQGELQGCLPSWNCTAWSACQPLGFQFRECRDTSFCEDDRTKPKELLNCVYAGSCNDNIKNGIEEGVDCGGPCEKCPTCSDQIQNQGEGGVDCGGPCAPCPSCSDNLLNQDESDIDCGGVCPSCSGNQTCKSARDCESLKCLFNVCTFATCSDQVRNQNETGIDCGGPCPRKCGTCNDGIKSDGETGVDCGGTCRACPNCFDGRKNQGEKLIDCGGICRECQARDFIRTHPIVTVSIVLAFLLINAFFYGYTYLLIARPERAKRLYDNNSFFMFITEMNRLTRGYRRFRGIRPVLTTETYNQYRSELARQAGGSIDSLKLHQQIMRIYTNILGLPDNYDDHIFYTKARESRIPLFLRVLLVGFYKKADILQVNTFIPHEKKIELISEFKFLLSELVQE